MAEDLQRILECPMCLELYNSSDRWPKLLPCQHTFCRTCLVHLDKQGSIACPQCRQQHKSPAGGAQQLPNNFTMLALLDVHNKSASSSQSPGLSSSAASPEPARDKAVDDSVRKAIAELAKRLQQKAGELSSIDMKRKTVDEKFLTVKRQVDAAFESRGRDLQTRKEAVIKQLAGMRQEELNLVDTQKTSAYQYLQKFQREFATMRESILTSQRPSQDQYNQLLTVCQRYTQQIEQYALSIDENLHEISFTDPNRTQLAVSINAYGVLQATGMDKTKSISSNSSINQLQNLTANAVPTAVTNASPGATTGSTTAPTSNLSTPEISEAKTCIAQSIPQVMSSPNINLQDLHISASTASTSSRSTSPSLASRNPSQPVPGGQSSIDGRTGTTTPGRKDSTGSVFAVSGSPSSSTVSSGDSYRVSSERSPAAQITRREAGDASGTGSRNPFSSGEAASTSSSGLNISGITAKTSLPTPVPSSSLPVSRSHASSNATHTSPLTRHASLDKPPLTKPKPDLPSRTNLGNFTRHASIDFSSTPSPASRDSSPALTTIGEQSLVGSRPVMLSIDSNSSRQSSGLTSPDGPVPPLPPRRVKTTQAIRPRSMSADAGSSLGAKDSWVRFDTIGSRSRRFGKERNREVAVIGSGWFGGSFFERPTGVAVLPQNLMAVVDERNHCVTMVTEAGQLVKSLGVQGNGQGQFQFPKSICLNSRRQMIVTDWWNHRIQIWDINGQFISQFGKRGSQAAQFSGPMGVACDASDNIFVCDANNHCVKVFSPDGKFMRQIGKEGHGEGCFICPSHLVVSPGGELLITDSGKHCVQMFSNHGTFLYQFGEWGTGPGQLNCPTGIMIDPSGYLFVSSSGNHRVEVYNPSGSFAASLGTHGQEQGQFDEPFGIASTSDGQVVVCDSGNKRVQIMWP